MILLKLGSMYTNLTGEDVYFSIYLCQKIIDASYSQAVVDSSKLKPVQERFADVASKVVR